MAILDYMGKDRESSFLSPEMQSNPSPHGEGAMLLSSKCILPQLLPKIQHYPSLQINPHSSIGKDSFPFKMQTPYKSFPTKSFLYLDFSHYFLFYCISFLFFSFFFFFFLFSKSWNSSPKWKNYSQRLGRPCF